MPSYMDRRRRKNVGRACEQRDADDRLLRAKLTPELHADRLELARAGLVQASAHAKAAARVLAEYATADRGTVLLIESIGAQVVRIATHLRLAETPARERRAWE